MSQHDYLIANAAGAVVRADLNDALEAIGSLNGGPTAPAVTFPHMFWLDESTNLLKSRNAANTAWVVVGEKNGNDWQPYVYGAAGGLGPVDPGLPPNNDLDDVVRTGWVAVDGSTANRPSGSALHVIHTMRLQAGQLIQLAFRGSNDGNAASDGPFYRASIGGGWTTWRRLPHRLATQAEAEAGTDNEAYVTSLRVAQAIAALGSQAKITALAADEASTSTTPANVTGLSIAIAAGETWYFEFQGAGRNATGTAGKPCISVNGPAAPTSVVYAQSQVASDVAQAAAQDAYDQFDTTQGGNANDDWALKITGKVINGSNAGNLVARLRRAGGSGTATLLRGSIFRAWKG